MVSTDGSYLNNEITRVFFLLSYLNGIEMINVSHKNLFAGASSACLGDEGLSESWFEEQMDDEGLVTEEKARKPW